MHPLDDKAAKGARREVERSSTRGRNASLDDKATNSDDREDESV